MSTHSPLSLGVAAASAPAVDPVAASSPFGRRAFIAGVAGGVAGAVAGAALVDSPASAAPVYSAYEAFSPNRFCDTRPREGAFGFTRLGPTKLRVKIAGRFGVPDDATAAVLNVIGINGVPGANWLAVIPAGSSFNTTSSLNMNGFRNIVPNLVTVQLGSDGSVDIVTESPCDVVVDLAGVYRPTGGSFVRAGRFRALAEVQRVIDTRGRAKPRSGETVRIDLSALAATDPKLGDAIAVVANLTSVQSTNGGYLTVYPFGESRPNASVLNVVPGENRAGAIFAKVGRDSSGRLGFNVFVSGGAHVLVDVAGYMTGAGDSLSTTGQFVALAPSRLLDTRRLTGARKRLWPGWTRAIPLPADVKANAQAVAVNLTATRSMQRGFFTLRPAQSFPRQVSNLNVSGVSATAANHAISRVSTSGIECYTSGGGDIVCDLVGYFRGSAQANELGQPAANPPPPPAALPYWMEIPRIPVSRTVFGGAADPIVNGGNYWHWTGTGLSGQGGAIVVFGHRTDAGGPLRHLHTLRSGDVVRVITPDSRLYIYEYTRREVTSKFTADILEATQRLGGETLSIVACTVGFDSTKSAYPDAWAPTSLLYRIVVTLTLKEWRDII